METTKNDINATLYLVIACSPSVRLIPGFTVLDIQGGEKQHNIVEYTAEIIENSVAR
jgi:hypothetical protein